MATVKITNELREQIISRANGMFSKRMEEARVRPEVDADAIYEGYLNSNPLFRDALRAVEAAGWAQPVSSIKLSILNLFGHRDFNFKRKHVIHDNWGTRYGVPGLILNDNSIPAVAELREKWELAAAKEREVMAERDAFVEGVKRVLNNSNTLKQALAIWPALWDLVPQAARDRYNDVTERAVRKTAVELDVDVDSLNVGLVTAKIVEGAL